MQVAILGRGIRPPWNEAVKNMAYFLAKQLASHGHNVHLVSDDANEIAASKNLEIHTVSENNFSESAFKIIIDLQRSGKIDLIHIQNLIIHRSLSRMLKSIKQKTHLPIVAYCCQLPSLSFPQWIKILRKDPREAFSSKIGMLVPSFQTTSAIKNVDITVASSYYLLHHLLGNTAIHNGDSRVVYPFIMEDRLERVVSNYNIQNNPIPTVLYLGSHRVLRGEDDFLKMIGNVKKNIPNVQATLVTPDPIPSRIKRLINRYELTDALKFLPRGVQLDLADLMVKSQVYVFTGLPPVGAIDPPLTIIEALIMGTPVVSYNAGGISEILAEENLVNYGDVEGLTHQVKTILEGSSVKHPRPGLLERYGAENATRNFEKLYNELV